MSATPLRRGDSEVVALLGDAGFFVPDLGGLREGGQMQQVGAAGEGAMVVQFVYAHIAREGAAIRQ